MPLKYHPNGDLGSLSAIEVILEKFEGAAPLDPARIACFSTH